MADQADTRVKRWLPFPEDQGPPEGWPTEFVAASDFDVVVAERDRALAERDRMRTLVEHLIAPLAMYEPDRWVHSTRTVGIPDDFLRRCRAALSDNGGEDG